jgi:hypothetical protein
VCSYKLSVTAVNELSANDITLAVRKINKWKAPGPDKLHKFGLKSLNPSTLVLPTVSQTY